MIHLTREIQVKSFVASGIVSVGEKRPEFLAVARLAQDLGGNLDAKTVQRQLFNNMPEQIGRLVVERCVALGLLDEDGKNAKLSENGRLALEKGEVPVPQEGEWKVWHVDDALCDESIIHVERVQGEKMHSKHGQQQGGQETPRPKALGKLRCITSISDGRMYKLEQLAEKGQNEQPGKLRIEILWEKGAAKPVVRLSGDLNGKKIDHSLSCMPQNLKTWTFDKLWRHLVLASDHGRHINEFGLRDWAVRGKQNVLPVTFQGTSSAERSAMRTKLAIPSPRLGGIGQFNSTDLDGVALVPRSAADAEEWAAWLQWEALNNYQTPATIYKINEEIMEKFPYYHGVCLPDHLGLLNIARNKASEPKSRFVLAPFDLGLWR